MDLTGEQKKTILAAFLGWMLDAFDFFILVFTLPAIAKEFGVNVPDVAYAIFLTLAMRFIGAYFFGRLGDRVGAQARPYAQHRLLLDSGARSGGARADAGGFPGAARPVRHRHGRRVGPGGVADHGIDPAGIRGGFVSGLLQCGYPTGFLLASIVFGVFYDQTYFGVPTLGWRAMFLFSILPALLVLFIRGARAGIAGLLPLEAQAKPKPGIMSHARRQLARVAVRHRAHDVLQPVLPRHAGPLPGVPAEAAPV